MQTRVIFLCVLFGGCTGPEEWYLPNPGVKPGIFLVCFFYRRGWFATVGWSNIYLRERRHLRSIRIVKYDTLVKQISPSLKHTVNGRHYRRVFSQNKKKKSKFLVCTFLSSRFSCVLFPNIRNWTFLTFCLLLNFTKRDRTPPET